MRVLVFGASGIVGQHLRLSRPADPSVAVSWYRRHADPITRGCDVTNVIQLLDTLTAENPVAIVNLAGESNVDIVERDPDKYYGLNVLVPFRLAEWCHKHGCRYIHISSQAVFAGDNPPYGPDSLTAPVNEYGSQKLRAEIMTGGFDETTILRLSFVLGVRPLPHVGRKNPLESMFDGTQPKQVCDRWFSPLFARDAAEFIWDEILAPSGQKIRHAGIPEKWSRYNIATRIRVLNLPPAAVHPYPLPISHDDFLDTAPRPINTAYDDSSWNPVSLDTGLRECAEIPFGRAAELALFFGISETEASNRLARGFPALHAAVAEDFRRSGASESDPDSLLRWYRETDSYIWELSAYHDDPGFNYSGMCAGIAARLRTSGLESMHHRVLCLGDGIGDLTMEIRKSNGQCAVYHDLQGSLTSRYAHFRYWREFGDHMPHQETAGWSTIEIGMMANSFDAVVSLDFLEHVPNVEDWVRALHAALVPGGLFCAQNAFACGSGPSGSIPMHLSCNDRFEADWDPMLSSIGFEQLSSNWYRKR